MILTSLGRMNQTTPGTPITLSAITTLRVCKILFQVIPGLTGKAYVGTPGLNKTTLAGVARVLAPNASSGISDQYLIEAQDGKDIIYPCQLAFDMDNANEGLLISYWTE